KRLDDRVGPLRARFRLALSRTAQRDVTRFGKLDRPGHRGRAKVSDRTIGIEGAGFAKRVAWQAIASRVGATKISAHEPGWLPVTRAANDFELFCEQGKRDEPVLRGDRASLER